MVNKQTPYLVRSRNPESSEKNKRMKNKNTKQCERAPPGLGLSSP